MCYVIIASYDMITIQYPYHIMSFCLTVKIYYLRSDDVRSSTEATYGIGILSNFYFILLCGLCLTQI